jgi:hypothetical protein
VNPPPHGLAFDILPADDQFWEPVGGSGLNAKKEFAQKSLHSHHRWRESNPHPTFVGRDFESCASSLRLKAPFMKKYGKFLQKFTICTIARPGLAVPYPPGRVALAGARRATRGDRPGASPGPVQPIRYVQACDPVRGLLESRADMQAELVRVEGVRGLLTHEQRKIQSREWALTIANLSTSAASHVSSLCRVGS